MLPYQLHNRKPEMCSFGVGFVQKVSSPMYIKCTCINLGLSTYFQKDKGRVNRQHTAKGHVLRAIIIISPGHE
ncbi:unnamed protein product [Hermetia illucens]|uniref:Uncharacterized protein n=1 Tax=Hermetia illucens TaxID=343691 RepID=A0A7R8UJV7_HERIL|nr:unnamed protein product [Hermetia illucens]